MVPLLKALSKRCYLMSEPHLGGFRLIIGFERLTDVQAAHTAVSNVSPTGGVGTDQAGDSTVTSQSQASDDAQRYAPQTYLRAAPESPGLPLNPNIEGQSHE